MTDNPQAMTTTPKPFDAHAHLYDTNVQEADRLRVVPGKLFRPTGGHEPGVVIFYGSRFKYALTASQAYSFASAIADTLEANKAQQPRETRDLRATNDKG